MLEVFFEGNSIEIWQISFSSGRQVMLSRYCHRDGHPPGLQPPSSQGPSTWPGAGDGAPWHGYTVEQTVRCFPDDCESSSWISSTRSRQRCRTATSPIWTRPSPWSRATTSPLTSPMLSLTHERPPLRRARLPEYYSCLFFKCGSACPWHTTCAPSVQHGV